MLKIETFEDLTVWQRSHEAVLEVYALTRNFPPDERFGLISQMRRAAVSIPANIAEGFRKRSVQHRKSFYGISHSSLEELRYYLRLSCDLEYIRHEQADSVRRKLEETSKMLRVMTS